MRKIGLAALLAAMLAMPGLPAQASTIPAVDVSAGYTQAMARDLGIGASQVPHRLKLESQAAITEQNLRESLGDHFGGAWFDEAKGTLVVGITNAALASKVRAAGVSPQVVKHSAASLDGVRRSLDRAPRPAADAVSSWYVDPQSNSVTITVVPGADSAAREFLAASGVDASATRIVYGKPAVPAIDSFPVEPTLIYGGGKLDLPATGGFCSSGFAIVRSVEPIFGMISAGHCGQPGDRASFQLAMSSGRDGGTFRGSQFPGAGDYSLVTHDFWAFEGTPFVVQEVLDYTGRAIPVDGHQEASVGASICRSGASSGWRCGRVTARNVTVNYVEGATFGLTQTTASATFGDSGGPFLAGHQAQGVLSGIGGGASFFQPIRPVLRAYGVSLMTRFGAMPG